MKTFFYSSVLFFIQLIATAQNTGSFHTVIQYGGQGRQLSFFVPTTYDASLEYNLIVGLHGLGDESDNYRNALISSNWDTAFPNTIFVCPDGGNDQNSDFYEPLGDEGVIQAAIDYTVSEYSIDTNEIVLQGFSLGGRSALKYGLAHPDKFKGLYLHTPALQGRADVENTLQPTPANEFQYNNASQLPIYITVGENDVLYEQTLNGLYPILKKNNAILKYAIISGLGHLLPSASYLEEGKDFINQDQLDAFSVDVFDIEIEDRTCENFIQPKCLIRNVGSEALTSVVINYNVDGVEYIYNWTGMLGSFEHQSIELPLISNLSDGEHVILCELGMLNASHVDPNINDDSIEKNVITGESIYTLPFTEDFEGGLSDWYLEDNHNLFGWESDDEVSFSGNTSISTFNVPFIFNTQGLKEAVYSPLIDLTGGTSSMLTLSFKHAFNYLQFTPPVSTVDLTLSDTLEVFISTDCGETYTSILKKAGADLATVSSPILNPLSIQACIFSPEDTNWSGLEMDISAYTSFQEARFKLEYTSNLGGTLYIDDFKVNYQPLSTVEVNNVELNIYPNPAQSYFMLSNVHDENIMVSVIDLTGKIVLSRIITQKNEPIDISNLLSGSYIVNMVTEQSFFSKMLIIE